MRGTVVICGLILALAVAATAVAGIKTREERQSRSTPVLTVEHRPSAS